MTRYSQQSGLYLGKKLLLAHELTLILQVGLVAMNCDNLMRGNRRAASRVGRSMGNIHTHRRTAALTLYGSNHLPASLIAGLVLSSSCRIFVAAHDHLKLAEDPL